MIIIMQVSQKYFNPLAIKGTKILGERACESPPPHIYLIAENHRLSFNKIHVVLLFK